MVLIFLFLIGIFFGSFLGVLSDRLPKNKNVLTDRSKCDYCNHTLGVLDLIPLLSYAALKGKCRYCDHKLSIFYPAIEMITGILFVTTAYYLPITLYQLPFYFFIISSLIVVFFADLKYGIIPDKIVFPAIVITFLYGLILNPSSLFINLLSGIGASIFLLIISYVFFLITKKESMGGGDIKFAFLMGLFLSFPNIVIALYIAFLTGAIYSIILILWGRKSFFKDTIPFGPFLTVGTVTSIFWGDRIFQLFLRFLGA